MLHFHQSSIFSTSCFEYFCVLVCRDWSRAQTKRRMSWWFSIWDSSVKPNKNPTSTSERHLRYMLYSGDGGKKSSQKQTFLRPRWKRMGCLWSGGGQGSRTIVQSIWPWESERLKESYFASLFSTIVSSIFFLRRRGHDPPCSASDWLVLAVCHQSDWLDLGMRSETVKCQAKNIQVISSEKKYR